MGGFWEFIRYEPHTYIPLGLGEKTGYERKYLMQRVTCLFGSGCT